MTVKTMSGRVYIFVGKWDANMVFAPVDGKDDEVMIYSDDELKELMRRGRLVGVDPGTLQAKQYC
jgi:hypothetical protein